MQLEIKVNQIMGNFEQIALGAGVPAQIAGMLGTQTVSRTGYNEADFIDYGAKSIKADISLNYRPNGDDLDGSTWEHAYTNLASTIIACNAMANDYT